VEQFAAQNIQYDKRTVVFDYEGKKWTATIVRNYSCYKNSWQKITNIKLPNDGFVYSDVYAEKSSDSLDVQNEDAKFLMDTIVATLPERFLDKAWFRYDTDASRAALFFKSVATNEMITVKFEYGWYTGHKNDKVYTRDELKKLLGKG